MDGVGSENKTFALQSLHIGVRVVEVVCKGQLPLPRTAHRLEYLPRRTLSSPVDSLLLVGGRAETGDELNDLHLFVLERDAWVALRPPPGVPLRRNFGVGFAQQLCVQGPSVFLFGGLTDNSFIEAHLCLLEINLG